MEVSFVAADTVGPEGNARISYTVSPILSTLQKVKSYLVHRYERKNKILTCVIFDASLPQPFFLKNVLMMLKMTNSTTLRWKIHLAINSNGESNYETLCTQRIAHTLVVIVDHCYIIKGFHIPTYILNVYSK